MIQSQFDPGLVYTFEHIRNGVVIDTETVHNLIPTVGQNHMLDVVFKSGTAYASWYVGLYEGNYTPTVNTTMTNVVVDAVECTAYTETTRELFVSGTIAGGVIDNTASKAEFTMNAAKTIYGGFMCSNNQKLATTGMLISVVKLQSPKVVSIGDILRVTAGVTSVSA